MKFIALMIIKQNEPIKYINLYSRIKSLNFKLMADLFVVYQEIFLEKKKSIFEIIK